MYCDSAADLRTAYGLPRGGVVLATFNSANKQDPRMYRLWMRLLRRLPTAVLCFLLPPGDDAAGVARNILQEARASGLRESRIVFAPHIARAAHLARYLQVDLFLDSHLYTAHSTASDCLWVGAPVVTAPSDTFQVCTCVHRCVRAFWCARLRAWSTRVRANTSKRSHKYKIHFHKRIPLPQGRVAASLLRALGQEWMTAWSIKVRDCGAMFEMHPPHSGAACLFAGFTSAAKHVFVLFLFLFLYFDDR